MKTFEIITETDIVQEIKRISARDYPGGRKEFSYEHAGKNIKELPGGSGLTYTVNRSGGVVYIMIFDPQGKQEPPRQGRYEFEDDYNQRLKIHAREQKRYGRIVGKLRLDSAPFFPIPGAQQVGTITTDESYRGIGLAKALYGIALSVLKRPLLAGGYQTPGGRRNWVSLSQIPGVEMKGYVGLLDQYINSKEIDIIMGKLGGQHIGARAGRRYFAFDVLPNATATELEAHVNTQLSQVYGYDGDYRTGLFAIWTGQ